MRRFLLTYFVRLFQFTLALTGAGMAIQWGRAVLSEGLGAGSESPPASEGPKRPVRYFFHLVK